MLIIAPKAKPLDWRGSAKDDVILFPEEARIAAGQALRKVQFNQEPSDWKAVSEWGAGVAEIRIHSADGIYRVVYVARFPEAVYVLHGFQKKSQKTSKRDIGIIKARYKEVINERSKR